MTIGTIVSLLIVEMLVWIFIPVRNVGPSFSVFDPIYGSRLKKDFSCSRHAPEFTMALTTNSHGFRGPEPTGQNPVLFLGDSFTLGYGVNDGEEFVQLVGNELAAAGLNAPVWNAGIGGAGNGHWIKFLEHEASELAPRLVVLQCCSNDFIDNDRESMFELNDDDMLIAAASKTLGWKRRAQGWMEAVPGLSYSHLIALIKQAASKADRTPNHIYDNDDKSPEAATHRKRQRLTLALVDRAIALCKEHRWPVIGINITDGQQSELLAERFETAGVTLLRIPQASERPEIYFENDGHWNAKGHAEVARLLTKVLTSADWRNTLRR